MSAPLALFVAGIATPAGAIEIVVDEQESVRALYFADDVSQIRPSIERYYGKEGSGYSLTPRPLPSHIRAALEAYFAGDLTAIDALPVATKGTVFQRQVWAALRTIPAGTTISYGELSHRIGNPKAVRAVGLANGANPIAIVVPCHRVIGANGSLTGYAGGIERKQWLLEHESAEQRLF